MSDALISRAVWLSGCVGFLELWNLFQGRVYTEKDWECGHVNTIATIMKSGVGERRSGRATEDI